MLSLIYLDGGRMEKIIKKHLTVSSDSRYTEKLWNEIYSKDKGTAVFKFTVDELTAQKVIFLFYFKNTKRYITINASIEGDTITVPFDSSLIVESEPVIGYVYFEKVEQSMDVYSFTFNVKVSAIDKANEAPLVERATGRIVDAENIVTKQELDALFAKIKKQGGTYDDSGLRTEISNISAEIETLKTKTDKGTVYDDSALKQRLEALESKPEIETSSFVTKQELNGKGYLTQHQPLTEYVKKTELPQPYNDTEIKERVASLESKSEVDNSGLVTKQELESKNYLTQHQDISRLATKDELSDLVTKQELRDKNYLTQHQSLEDYALKSEIPTPYNDLELKKRVESLESKPYLDTSNFVTNEVLNSKGYLTQHQSLEGYAKKSEIPQAYNDTELKDRVAHLESKSEVDTSGLVTKQELDSKGYLTEHQPLTEYVKKSELPQTYNDTEIKERVSRLENKPEVDTSGLVTKQELAGKGYLTEHQSLTEYAKKTELPQPYNDTELKTRVQTLETKAETLATKEEVKAIKLQAGERGEKGQKGDTGERGPKGDKGETGERGPIGPQGLQGIQGIQGLKGERGERGVAGMPGLKGNDGPRGPIGLTGPKGADGAPGQNIINQNGGQPLKYWAGTKSQYDAIAKKDASTIYDIYTA